MSYKNLKLKVWVSKTDATDVRAYIDVKYVDFRDEMSGCAEGDYLCAGPDGGIISAFKGQRDGRVAQCSVIGRRAVIDFLTLGGTVKLTFSDLLVRMEACRTASGNFSATQYEKKYNVPLAEAV